MYAKGEKFVQKNCLGIDKKKLNQRAMFQEENACNSALLSLFVSTTSFYRSALFLFGYAMC